MTPELDLDLGSIEARLRVELAEVMAALVEVADVAAIVALDQSAVGRVSRGDALQQQAIAMSRQQRLDIRRRKLDAALNRIAAGSYGMCCECEVTLDRARLDSDLAVVFCIDCQEERNS
jgi:DnaK suppressor protein